MALQDLSDPAAVRHAIAEYDRLGQVEFLKQYRFGPATRYRLAYRGEFYDSKAIVAAAHRFQFGQPLTRLQLSGGVGPRGAVRKLRALGFTVHDDHASGPASRLQRGVTYSWTELGSRFEFAPDYFAIAGGMISRPQHDAMLLITHPDPRSFDYEDTWDGNDLIYSGRGKRGDQRYAGANRDVGENRRELHVFEPASARALTYLGQARCVEVTQADGIDLDGRWRTVLRFRLRFDRLFVRRALGGAPEPSMRRSAVSRPFDPQRVPVVSAAATKRRTPEEVAQLREKAVRGHYGVLVTLHAWLKAAGWSDLIESPTAFDLWGRTPEGKRVIFEAKTIRPTSERSRVRGALAQLQEYQFFYGSPDDELCLVTDRAISLERTRFLEALGIACVICTAGSVFAASPRAIKLLPGIRQDSPPR